VFVFDFLSTNIETFEQLLLFLLGSDACPTELDDDCVPFSVESAALVRTRMTQQEGNERGVV